MKPAIIHRTTQAELTPSETLYTDSIDYLLGGALTLRNGRIDKYQFDEGYCQAERYTSTKDDFTFCYYDKDHLGNVRQVTELDGSRGGNVIQRNNYYPFGAEFCDNTASNSVQLRKYNGKEFDNMHGLNTYDYGARQYNPVTARWDRMDRYSEKYYSVSPYVYCMNNPVKFIDPDGQEHGKPEEIWFALRPPLATERIGAGVTHGSTNISTNAMRFATRGNILYGTVSTRQEERGSENGAFRHALWQAQITSEFGGSIAKQAGDAHEDNPNIDMSKTFFTNIDEADQSVDLHNNIIGRSIGENNKGAKMNTTANAVLDVFETKGLYQAKKVSGGYKVVQLKLDKSKANMLRSIFNQLDENGMYSSERLELMIQTNEKIQRYEKLQNSVHWKR